MDSQPMGEVPSQSPVAQVIAEPRPIDTKKPLLLSFESEMLSSQTPTVASGMHPLRATVEDCHDEASDVHSFPADRRLPSGTPDSTEFNNASTTSNDTAGSDQSSNTIIDSSSYSSRERTPVIQATPFESRQHQPPAPEYRPNPMDYLDSAFPLSPEAVQRVVRSGGRSDKERSSPSVQSQGSSVGSSYRTGVFSNAAADTRSSRSWSPDRHGPGQYSSSAEYANRSEPPPPQAFFQLYSPPPETPHNQVNTPHFSQTSMHPQYSGPPPQQMPQFTPPERVPLSGYQLLAIKLAGELAGPPVKPIYRRFEALNHRLLLHVQDELAELEEQLHSLDVADTQARWQPQGILPACRRHWILNPNMDDLKHRKTEILGHIGFKMDRYKQILSSYKEVQDLPRPDHGEIRDYRSYLAIGRCIAENETKFLDCTDDLVSLASYDDRSPDGPFTDGLLTPMPRPVEALGFPPANRVSDTDGNNASRQQPGRGNNHGIESQVPVSLAQLALAMAVALLVPILTFIVIPGFVGRMTVVSLVGFGVAMAVVQSGLFKELSTKLGVLDWLVWVGVYGGVMAVVAGSFG